MRGGRLLIAGLDGSGKSTLADLVEGSPSDHRHREDCYYRSRTLEVPARYLENHWMHSIILMLAQNQAAAMALLMDAAERTTYYSTGYARASTVDCLGVVTKSSEAAPEDRADAVRKLCDAGCGEVVCVCTKTGEGVDEFLEWVDRRVARTNG